MNHEVVDRQLFRDLVEWFAIGNANHERDVLTGLDALNEPDTNARQLYHAKLTEHDRLADLRAALLGEHQGALERFLGTVEIRLKGRRGITLAERRAEQVLAQLQARAQFVGQLCVRCLGPDFARYVSGSFEATVSPQSCGTSKLDVELESLVANGLRQRGQLGQRIEPIGRPTQRLERIVPNSEQLLGAYDSIGE